MLILLICYDQLVRTSFKWLNREVKNKRASYLLTQTYIPLEIQSKLYGKKQFY
jgi:hypothetical protein